MGHLRQSEILPGLINFFSRVCIDLKMYEKYFQYLLTINMQSNIKFFSLSQNYFPNSYFILLSNKTNKWMLQQLNYYSRYNRIKNHLEIQSLLQYIDKNNLSKCLDDSHLFCIPYSFFTRQKQELNENRRGRNIWQVQEHPQQHKRYSSYDPHNKKKSFQGTNQIQNQQNCKNSQMQPELSIPRLEQNDRIDSIKNRTNLQDLNCLETESIRHGQQSQEFSQCERHAQFQVIDSNKEDQRHSSFNQSNEDNFSSVKLNNLFDLRKNSMNEHTPMKLQEEFSKSECLQRAQLSDIEIEENSLIQKLNDEQLGDDELFMPQKFVGQIQVEKNQSKDLEEKDSFQGQSNHFRKLSQKLNECNLVESRQIQEQPQTHHFISPTPHKQSLPHQSYQNYLIPEQFQQQREQYDACDQNYQQQNDLEESERLQQNILGKAEDETNKNGVENMFFGYSNGDQMRIGYENYTSANKSRSQKQEKQQLDNEKEATVLEDDRNIAVSIIKEHSNTASKISVSERKPFKKFMMNKKLNPRMATSTIVNELGEKKPQKVNFKKMMKHQKSENRVKFQDLASNDSASRRLSTPKKSKLIQAFFEQN